MKSNKFFFGSRTKKIEDHTSVPTHINYMN